jgi:hypothetical protein
MKVWSTFSVNFAPTDRGESKMLTGGVTFQHLALQTDTLLRMAAAGIQGNACRVN